VGSEEVRAYIIAGTPRSGSSWLCAWLHGCGAGNPREWINRHAPGDWFQQMAQHNPPFILALKVFWVHLERNRMGPEDILYRMGPDARWVYLDRRDKLRQALSLARVRASNGKWTQHTQHGPVTPIPIPFDPDRIASDIRELEESAQQWRRFFDAQTIDPLAIYYEDMQADVRPVVRQVLAHIGAGVFREVDITLQKQAGEDVELLVKRYEQYQRTADNR
jgi:LPS sulfotransferase NodH